MQPVSAKKTAHIHPDLEMFIDEMRIDQLVQRRSAHHRAQSVFFRNVHVIPMTSDTILRHRGVLVRQGRIAEVAIESDMTIPNDVLIVDGQGGYLMPGLTDAHVHIGESNAEKLLNVLNGVTTVREMCGFDWMIPYREKINRNEILAPTTYVAGTMLNHMDLRMYSRVVMSIPEAHRTIDQQIETGYDFIKVWNVMPYDLLKAISEKCVHEGIDLVGHIPHHVSVKDALALRYRTMEHFKGFLLDNTLQISEENYVAAMKAHDSTVWLCPTFALHLQGLKGEEAMDRLRRDRAYRYVPSRVKERWMASAKNDEFGPFGNVPDSIFDKTKRIFRDLASIRPDYIAGKDNNGSNVNMVAGFTLLEELRVFKSLGMSNYDVLKTATSNPARAMRREKVYGTIQPGQRADLILLLGNPLDDLSHLMGEKGVMVRGIWLSQANVEDMFSEIESIYYGKTSYGPADYEALLQHVQAAEHRYLVKPTTLRRLARTLMEIGQTDTGIEILQPALDAYPYYYLYNTMADLHLAKKDTAQAINYLIRSRETYDGNPYANRLLKQLKEAQADPKQ